MRPPLSFGGSNEVCSAKCGEEVVECDLIGQVEGGAGHVGFVLVSAEDVVPSSAECIQVAWERQREMRPSPRTGSA